MLEIIIMFDEILFHFINSNLNTYLLNYIFIFFHDCHKNIWFIIPLLFFWIYNIYINKKNRLQLIILIPLSILITDQIGSIIKDIELRNRPYMSIDSDEINLLVEVAKNKDGTYKNTNSSRKSFPSNHAANICALSTILIYLYNNKKKYFLVIAFLISISRVYIGVHYPVDIMMGAALGICISLLIIWLSKKLIRQNIIR